MKIEIYTFEDVNGKRRDHTTQDPTEARNYAKHHELKWIALTYEFTDSELVEDYTPEQEHDDDEESSGALGSAIDCDYITPITAPPYKGL